MTKNSYWKSMNDDSEPITLEKLEAAFEAAKNNAHKIHGTAEDPHIISGPAYMRGHGYCICGWEYKSDDKE